LMAFSAIYPHGRAYGTAGAAASELEQAAALLDAGDWATFDMLGITADLFRADGNHMLGYMNKGCWDPLNARVRFIAKAASSILDATRDYEFTESDNTVRQLENPSWNAGGELGHGYQHNALDPATGDLYWRPYGTAGIVWRHRASDDTWVQIATAPNGTASSSVGAIEWLPTIGTAGGLVWMSDKVVQRWDKATDTWETAITTTLDQGIHAMAIRNVAEDLVYVGGGNEDPTTFHTVGASGGLTAIAASPVNAGVNASCTTACPVSGDMISVYGDSVGYKYTLATDTWAALSGVPNFGPAGKPEYMIAIPITTYGVVMFFSGHSRSPYLYRHAA